MKIVILDGYTANPGDLSWAALEALGELKVHERTEPEQVLQRAAGAAVVLTNKTPLHREEIRKLTDLKYIGVLATGYNVVNVEAAKKRGVVVTNVPDYATASVAQHTVALMLDLALRVGQHSFEVRRGAWSKQTDFAWWRGPLVELAGKTLGVIGYGRTGRAVAAIAKAMGMRVIAATPRPPKEADVEIVPLDSLLATSDVISLHCPLTLETERLINAARLAACKPGAWLINTGRGALIDEEAVAEALRTRQLGHAALDVLADEPPSPKHPLLRAPRCVVTGHMAWATHEARARLIDGAVANVKAWLDGKPRNVVSG